MRFTSILATIVLFSGVLSAHSEIKITGKSKYLVPTQPYVKNPQHTQSLYSRQLQVQSPVKSITVLNAKLSDKVWEALAQRAETLRLDPTPHLPGPRYSTPGASRVQLGMNNVPVFEQGEHGSCAMFAATAAVDAALGKGDYISQLCQLQLGRHLERLGYIPSGWDGSNTPLVLNQLLTFGFVNTTEQRETGCGDYTEYPTHQATPETEMSLSAFHEISEPFPDEQLDWSSVLNDYHIIDRVDPKKTRDAIKTSLRKGDRLTLGVLLIGAEEGVIGATGKHREPYDTWVLTPEVVQAVLARSNVATHAMVITGFDDDAVALDEQGTAQQGLFTLRNSWGSDVGDHGDFYMTYTYFTFLATEVQRIRSLRRFMM
jgi:hypothetical protein